MDNKLNINLKPINVAFIMPPSRSFSPRPPMGILILASYIEKFGHNVSIVDIKGIDMGDNKLKFTEDDVIDKIVERVKEIKPEVIAIGVLVTDVEPVFKLLRVIKTALPNVKIVVGNSHPSMSPETYLFRDSPVDFIVFGDGEVTFEELLKEISKDSQNFSKVSGLGYLKNNKIIKTEERPLPDLNDLPLPAYHLIDMKFYTKPTIYCIRGVLVSSFYVFTSRGCPYRCSFCAASNEARGYKKMRFRDPEKAVDEIEVLIKKYNVDAVYFQDDTFTLKRSHAIAICNEIKRRKLRLIWGCETRVDHIDDELVKIMKGAGCVQIDFGIESGSQRMLDAIRKDVTVEQILKASSICRKYGLRHFANFMINMPGETLEDIEQSIKVAKKMKPNLLVWNVMSPYPGTHLTKSHYKEFTLKDFENIAFKSDYDKFLEFIDEKFRVSNHDISVKTLLYEKLYPQFPGAWDFSIKFNRSYIRGICRQCNFLVSSYWWNTLIKSKRKLEYLSWVKNASGTFINNLFSKKHQLIYS